MAALFFKCLLGALAVLIIALLSKTKAFYLRPCAAISHLCFNRPLYCWHRTHYGRSAHYRAVWAVFAYPVCGVSSCGVLL